MDIRNFQESLKINYEMYKDSIDKGYKALSYTEWLEMQYLSLIIERVNQIGKTC